TRSPTLRLAILARGSAPWMLAAYRLSAGTRPAAYRSGTRPVAHRSGGLSERRARVPFARSRALLRSLSLLGLRHSSGDGRMASAGDNDPRLLQLAVVGDYDLAVDDLLADALDLFDQVGGDERFVVL